MAAKTSIGIGIALIATAVISAVVSATSSVTAWIPAFFGLPIAGMGAVAAASERNRKNAMHIAAVLALLGVLGGVSVLPNLVAALGGAASGSMVALASRTALLVLSTVLLVVCIRSFVQARRARKA
jgi:hypothetical protein